MTDRGSEASPPGSPDAESMPSPVLAGTGSGRPRRSGRPREEAPGGAEVRPATTGGATGRTLPPRCHAAAVSRSAFTKSGTAFRPLRAGRGRNAAPHQLVFSSRQSVPEAVDLPDLVGRVQGGDL